MESLLRNNPTTWKRVESGVQEAVISVKFTVGRSVLLLAWSGTPPRPHTNVKVGTIARAGECGYELILTSDHVRCDIREEPIMETA